MYQTTIHHTYNIPGKAVPHTQGLLDLPIVQENAPLQANVRVALWDEIAQVLQSPSASIPPFEGKERFLWFLHFELHGENRIWWAYFQNRVELDTCLTPLTHAFPCFKLQSLEICPHGLRVCSAFYASSSSRQQRADAFQPEVAGLRDKLLFPLAPFACDYLTSFTKGLGDIVRCEQCHDHTSLPPAGTKPSSQA